MAACRSRVDGDAKEIWESASYLLPKHDNELDLELVLELFFELVLELVLEFDDMADTERPLPLVVSAISSSFCAHTADPNSSLIGERRASLICCRPSALRSTCRKGAGEGAGLGESVCRAARVELVGESVFRAARVELVGESVFKAAPVELVFVFGLDSLLGVAVLLGWLPIFWGRVVLEERRRSKLLWMHRSCWILKGGQLGFLRSRGRSRAYHHLYSAPEACSVINSEVGS
jgi:hypothetical protein